MPIDLVFGAEALIGPRTGIGTYAAELLHGLRRDSRIGSVRCFAGAEWLADPLVGPSAETAPPPPAPRPPIGLRLARRLARLVPGSLALARRQRARSIATMLNESGASLYHEPNFILRPFDGPTIANIHDLSVLRFPEFHPAERVEYMTRNLADTVARASRLVTGSELIRAEIIATLGVVPERVVTIHDGVGPAFRPMTAAELAPVLNRHGLASGSYLLAVGTLEPRKNLAALLAAYEGLPPALRARFPLVVAGGKGWRDEALLERLNALAARGIVRTLGYVPAEDLPALYAGARGFAFPSIYEGFGLPALEAAASGVPVLSAVNTPMDEVLGEHALLVEPRDPEALRLGLQRLLEDDTLGPAALAAAPGLRTRFAWDRCIERTIALYEALVRPA